MDRNPPSPSARPSLPPLTFRRHSGPASRVRGALGAAAGFLELIDGGTSIDYNWDAHANMGTYNRLAPRVDLPIAGLIRDLKAHGMLEDTAVVWTTEFGRTPCVPDPTAEGRGHHAKVYSSWVAGGGRKRGLGA